MEKKNTSGAPPTRFKPLVIRLRLKSHSLRKLFVPMSAFMSMKYSCTQGQHRGKAGG